MYYNKQIIWITGASSGIGEALTYSFNSDGAIVIISARRIEELERVKAASKYPQNVHIVVMDLANTAATPQIAQNVLAQFGHIDVLINNSGISQRSLTHETSLDVDRQIMEINFFGTVCLTKQVLPSMLARKSGHIVVTGSVVSKFGCPQRSAYAASKHAVQGFFETLRAEYVSQNINVSIIIAGRILTNISYNAVTKDGSPHGKLDPGQANGIDVTYAAQKIKRGLQAKKKEIYVVNKERIMLFLRRFCPVLFYKYIPTINPK